MLRAISWPLRELTTNCAAIGQFVPRTDRKYGCYGDARPCHGQIFRRNIAAHGTGSQNAHFVTSSTSHPPIEAPLFQRERKPSIQNEFLLRRCKATSTTSTPPDTGELFSDHGLAYASKSTWELMRTSGFFMLCRFQYITDHAEQAMSLLRRILGKRLSQFLIRKTIYEQFVAGTSPAEVTVVVEELRRRGVGALLALPMEDDVGTGTSQSEVSRESRFDDNLAKMLSCVSLCRQLDQDTPMFQLKGTALMSGDLAKEVSVLLGPETQSHDERFTQILEATVLGMRGEHVDFSLLPGWRDFSSQSNTQWNNALHRFQQLNQAIMTHDVIAMMDAEYTYMNPALRLLTLAMAEEVSRDKARVLYTYQAYLKNTSQLLHDDIEMARDRGVCFGAKLVRGAYMVKERHLASIHGYEDPVCESFDATTASYHSCLETLLSRCDLDPATTRFIIASHNEDTVRHAIHRIQTLGIPHDSPSVFFGQIYGMGDHLTFTLGHAKYQIVKSLPYGDIEDTMPYLARRAQENKSILQNARKEKALVGKALRDRLMLRA